MNKKLVLLKIYSITWRKFTKLTVISLKKKVDVKHPYKVIYYVSNDLSIGERYIIFLSIKLQLLD